MRLDELRIPYDLFLEDPYGGGIDYSAPVKRGTVLTSTEGEEVEFITVSDDGKVVVKDKDGMTLKLAPKVVAGAVRQRKLGEDVEKFHIVYRTSGNIVHATPTFNSKDAAQKYLMTKMFANHQDYKVVPESQVGLS